MLIKHVPGLLHLLQFLVYLEHVLYQKLIINLLQFEAQLLRQNRVMGLHWNENIKFRPLYKTIHS